VSAYCTQMDPNGSGGDRCGPASCASVLLSEGWQSDPWQLTLEVGGRCDPEMNGTTSDDLLNVMSDYGIPGDRWYGWDDLGELLEAGHAVLLLNENHLLVPRPYPSGSGFNATHWIRLVANSVPDAMLYVYDPLAYLYQPDGSVYQGPTVATAESVKAAGDATGYPEYGVYFVSPSGRRLNLGA
jgi:hypothetical protein